MVGASDLETASGTQGCVRFHYKRAGKESSEESSPEALKNAGRDLENPVFMGFFDAGNGHDDGRTTSPPEVWDFTRRKTARLRGWTRV